jgi:hypothetical protein
MWRGSCCGSLAVRLVDLGLGSYMELWRTIHVLGHSVELAEFGWCELG